MTTGSGAVPAALPVRRTSTMKQLEQPVATVLLAVLLAACSGGRDATSAPSTAGEPRTSAAPAASRPAPASSPAPTAAPQRAATIGPMDVPSRVVVESLGIDLPVVSGDLAVAGNPADYPLCDVAQYLTTYRYPGRPGTTTWIYGHARKGMFLPLLETSQADAGAALVGEVVDVYSTENRRYRYRITSVLPHSTDRLIANDVPSGERRLVLQTSEGPRGTVPKLQVAAVLFDEANADARTANPVATPRVCAA